MAVKSSLESLNVFDESRSEPKESFLKILS